MKRVLVCCAVTLVVGAAIQAQEPAVSGHVLIQAPEIKWGAAQTLEKGASFAVISGEPGKTGPFVIRIKLPAGFKIAPHWHPTDEHATVLSGTFALGMGEKFDPNALKDIPVGGYSLLPAEMRHFAVARTETTVQVHGNGPFAVNYVNPADDPRTRSAPAK